MKNTFTVDDVPFLLYDNVRVRHADVTIPVHYLHYIYENIVVGYEMNDKMTTN